MSEYDWLDQLTSSTTPDTPSPAADMAGGEVPGYTPIMPTKIGEAAPYTPYTPPTVEPEWEIDAKERMVKSIQESFGAIWMGAGALSASIGQEGARDFAIEQSNSLFEDAANHDISTQAFREISNPIDLAKFTTEKVIEFFPDLVAMMATGGATAAVTGGTKIAGTAAAKSAVKNLARKSLAKNTKSIAAKLGKDATSKEVQEAAYKTTLKELSVLTGIGAYGGSQATGQMYAQDVALRGVEEASPGAAIAGGVASAAIEMLNPFNRALSQIASKRGVSIAKMTLGEAAEEIAQGTVEKLHEAGVDPYLTVGEIFSDPQTYLELAEAGIVGLLVGGAYGGASRAVFGGVDEDSLVEDPNDVELVQESAAPQLSIESQRLDLFRQKLIEYAPVLESDRAALALGQTEIAGLLEAPRKMLEGPRKLPAKEQELADIQEFEREVEQYRESSWWDRFAHNQKVLDAAKNRHAEAQRSPKAMERWAAIKAGMAELEEDSNTVKVQEKSLPKNLAQRNTAKKAIAVKKEAINAKAVDIANEVTTPPTKEELAAPTPTVTKTAEEIAAEREVEIAEAMANVGGETRSIPSPGTSVASEEKGYRVEVGGSLTDAKAREVLKSKEVAELPIPETKDADLQLILDNDIDGLVSELRSYKNPEGAYTQLALKAKGLTDKYPHIKTDVLNVLKEVYKPATERLGTADTGAYKWNVVDGTYTTTNPVTKDTYMVVNSGANNFVLTDQDFNKISDKVFKNTTEARTALEGIVPIPLAVQEAEAAKAKEEEKAAKARKKTIRQMGGRVPKVVEKSIVAKKKRLGKAASLAKKAKDVKEVAQSADEVKSISVEEYLKAKGKTEAEIITERKKAAIRLEEQEYLAAAGTAEGQAKGIAEDKKARLAELKKKKAKDAKPTISKRMRQVFGTAGTPFKNDDGYTLIFEDIAASVFKVGQTLKEFSSQLRPLLGKAYMKLIGKIKAVYNKFNQHLDIFTYGGEVGAIESRTTKTTVTPEVAATKAERIVKKEEAESSTARMERDRKFVKDNKIVPEGVKSKAVDFKKSAWKMFQDVFTTVSERLRRSYPRVFNAMRKMEFKIHQSNFAHLKEVNSFIKGMKQVNAADEFSLSRALKNGDTTTRDIILKKYNLERDFAKVQAVLKDIERRADAVGLLDIKIENYFPRSVKDVDGLMSHYADDPATFGRVQYEIEMADKASGYTLSEADKAGLITQLLASGSYNHIPVPGASKKRRVNYVVRELNQYYHTSTDALVSHIVEMNDKIEARVMIGKSKRPTMMAKITTIVKGIEALTDKDTLTPSEQSKLDGLDNEYQLLYEKLKNVDAELDESVSNFILKDSKDKQSADQAIELVRARLKQRGTYGAVSTARNIAYAITLGSPTSAITQIGDLTWSIYRNNPINTMRGAAKAIRLMINKKGLTQEHFDFAHALQEMGSASSNKMLDTVLTWTGLKGMDIFAKETAMQSTIAKWAKKENRESFIEAHSATFGGKIQAAKVWSDVNKGKMTEDVLFAVYNDLSDWQPISLMEMPKGYLEAGNMRVFYMLKTFSIKALNSIHREAYTEFKKGNYTEGAKKLTGLILTLSLSGAVADELKDFLLGKESSIKDNTIDNMIQLFMVNKYAASRGMKTDTFMTSMVDSLIPPVRFADDFIADLYAASSTEKDFKFKTLKDVPVIGKVAWSHSEWGKAGELKSKKEDVYKVVRKGDSKETRKAVREYNAAAREFNRGKKGDDRESLITETTIKNLKRRERKKEKK